MFCSQCGKKLEENAKFCSNCGAMVKRETENSTSAPTPAQSPCEICSEYFTAFNKKFPKVAQALKSIRTWFCSLPTKIKLACGVAIIIIICFFWGCAITGNSTTSISIPKPVPVECYSGDLWGFGDGQGRTVTIDNKSSESITIHIAQRGQPGFWGMCDATGDYTIPGFGSKQVDSRLGATLIITSPGYEEVEFFVY